MATYTSTPGHIRVGAGTLWWAPLGTSEPSLTVTAGKLATVTGVSGWVNIGATDNGSTFARQVQTGDVTPEENFYPELIATTGITESVSFGMLYMSPDNWLLAFNGGTTSTAGSGATALTTYTPPAPGSEVNRMLIWQSADDTERQIWRSVFNVGQASIVRQKAPNKAVLAVEFRVLQPASGAAWTRYSAEATLGAPGSGA
jgi:hypothetical protein